jgi:hypothetical protein
MERMHWAYMTLLLGAACTASAESGCAGPVQVTRSYPAASAADRQREGMVPVAVVHGSDRVALPPGARVEGRGIVMPRTHVHKLAPGDVIEQDEAGRIVAVRSAGDPPIVTRFVPGTASSPAASDYVRGELADDAGIALGDSDAVVMRGALSSDGAISGAGQVETTRATGALVTGLLLFGLSYIPTAYVGLQASDAYDKVLAVPVAGPWMDLAQRPACVEPALPPGVKPPVDPCSLESLARSLLITSGAVQGLATILTVVGLPTHSEVKNEGPAEPGSVARTRPLVAVLPTPSGFAVSISGAL